MSKPGYLMSVALLCAAPVGWAAACPAISFSAAQVTNLGAPGGPSYRALLRQLDGTFTQYAVNASAPYAVTTKTPDSLGTILPCGVAAPPAAPFGGAEALVEALTRTGAASQRFAFGLTASAVGVMAFVAANSGSVQVFTATAALPLGAKNTASYPVGALAASVLLVDLNGDGTPEMIAVDAGSRVDGGGAVVFLGSPDGSFHGAVTYPAHTTPVSVTAADFNRDGYTDLAVANEGSGDVTVMLGRGDGTFLPARTYPAVKGAASVAAADLNRDGKLDLLVAGTGGAMVSLLGDGDGTFQQPSQAFPVNSPGGMFVAAGDFNGDGYPDAAVAGQQSGTVAVLEGNGDGTFAAAVNYPVAPQVSSLIVMDLNGDGRLDIVAASGTPYVIAGDHGSGDVSVLLGNGDGSFRAGSVAPAGMTPVAVAAADFNGDNIVDVVTANQGSNDLTYLVGKASGGFQPGISIPLTGAGTSLPAQPSALLTADFNRDRRPDLAVADYGSGQVTVLLAGANGGFSSPVSLPVGNNPSGLASADFNGDGNPDLAVADAGMNGTGDVMVFAGAGGGFTPSSTLAAGSHPVAVVAGDFNHDGKMDLASVSEGTFGADQGGVYLLAGNGDGTFQKAVVYPAGANPSAIAMGDFNRDGNPDLAVLSNTTASGASQLVVLLGSGGGTFTALPPMMIAAGAQAIAAADFNNDGTLDVAVTDGFGANSGVGLMAGNGDGTFQGEVFLPAGPLPVGIAVADFNRDNRPDLAISVSGATTPTGQGGAEVLLNQSPAAAVTVNGASFAANAPVAPDSIVSVFGSNLATQTEVAPPPLGENVAGTTVSVTGSDGVARPANIFYVSPEQVNFLVPSATPAGAAQASVISANGSVSSSLFEVAPIAPGIFTANAQGLAAAVVLRVHADGSQTLENVAQTIGNQIAPVPISLDPSTDKVYLELYGTGLRGAAQSQVSVTVGPLTLTPAFAGAQPSFAGLDQVNVLLPYSLKGMGNVPVVVTAAGHAANRVNVTIE
jgi:uncharacterized protein (TIGR03437 family)